MARYTSVARHLKYGVSADYSAPSSIVCASLAFGVRPTCTVYNVRCQTNCYRHGYIVLPLCSTTTCVSIEIGPIGFDSVCEKPPDCNKAACSAK